MIGIVNFGSNKTPFIADRLLSIGYPSRIIDWKQSETIDWDLFSGIILSGAPVLLSQTDHEVYTERFAFLKKSSVPVLGICFGHQLLGLLFGAEAFMGDEVRTDTNISILNAGELFKGFNKTVIMMEDHTEGITLPASFTLLASSEKYETEAMQHFTLPIYGVQFHPEVSSENGSRLFNNFCKLILK